MELVYLWVEDYKNIHRQGFNFSPRFHCEFKAVYKKDENGNEVLDKEKSELFIEENKNYLENFFGENINVRAIVGKNGSGKSSVLKLILYLIFCKNYKKYESDGDYNIGRLVDTLRQFSDKDLFLLIRKDDEFKKIIFSNFIKHLRDIEFGDETTTKVIGGSTIRRDELLPDIKELTKEELDFFTIHFNYMLDTLYDDEKDNWIKEIYHKADDYKIPLLLEPYKNRYGREVVDIEIINYLNNQKVLKFYNILNTKEVFSFFNPNKIKYTINIEKLAQKLINFQKDLDTEETKNTINELVKSKDYKTLNNIYIYTKSTKEFDFLPSSAKLTNNFVEEINKHIEESEYKDTPRETLKYWLGIEEYLPYHYQKLENSLKFRFNIINNSDKLDRFDENQNRILSIKENFELLENIPPWIDIEFYDDTKTMNSLSSGEKSLFTLLINLMYQVQNINDIAEYNTINLFLDETELGLHPSWQKKYLSDIVNALKIITKKNINIVFATHSPLLLSDIPKQNIIFLNTDENDNCVVADDGLKEKKETFGANIHTLLSDSFFMEDGLMGEFAQGKIEKVIEYLNSDDEIGNFEYSNHSDIVENWMKDKDKLKKFIEIIGEPFLRQKLLQMHHIKYPQTKEDRIEELEAEIERLKNDRN